MKNNIYVFGYMTNPKYCVDQHRSKICDMLSEEFIFTSLDDQNYHIIPLKADLFHSQPWSEILIAHRLFKLRNRSIKHLVTFYGTTLDYKLSRKFIKRADIITTVSLTTMYELLHLFGNADYRLIYDGVNTHFYRPNTRKNYNERMKVLMVITGARNHKNHRIFLEVAKNLSHVDFILRTFTKINKTDLPDNVYVIHRKFPSVNKYGESRELKQLYNSADVYLFPTIHEGLNNTVLEAMSCGLPIISFNATSMPELVTHDKNGFLCNSLQDMIYYVDYLSQTREGCIQIGKRSRSKAEWFTWDRCADGFRKAYRELLM